jgi:hypothetical protein
VGERAETCCPLCPSAGEGHRKLEECLRARIPADHARRQKPWKAFRPETWYEAVYEDEHRRAVILRNGRAEASWPVEEVQIRSAADDEWEIRTALRMDVAMEGQTLQIPGRIAECPQGHARQIPTRFDARVVELKCSVCARSYRLSAS